MVPVLSMVFMGVSAVISIGLPFALFLILKKKYALKVIPALTGAAAFIIFALVLEQLLHMLVLNPDANGNIALRTSNPFLYVLYGIFAAGIFEETARFLSFNLLKKKYTGIGTGLSYGIGHGGIEAGLLAGITMIGNLVLSIMIISGSAEIMNSLPLGAAQLSALTDTGSFLFLVSGIERIFAVVIQISLSLIVWYSVDKKGKWWLFPLAVLLHALIDIPAAMSQTGAISNIALVEGIIFIEAIAVAMLAVYICKKLKKNEAE